MKCERVFPDGHECKRIATKAVSYSNEPEKVVFNFCAPCLAAFRAWRSVQHIGNELDIKVKEMEAKDDESK